MSGASNVKRVTAGIILHEGKVLLARRAPDDSQGGKWEFPGGKIEPGETAEDCLVRELDEELGIGVVIEKFFMRSLFTYPKGTIELLAYVCTMTSPPTKMECHSEIAWVEPGEILGFELMEADVEIAKGFVEASS